MRRVYQDLFGGPDGPLELLGNCYPACVATIMGKELIDVPHFYQEAGLDQSKSAKAINTYAGSNGYGTVCLDFEASAESGHLFPGAIVIISGLSPRGQFAHAVVGKLLDNKGKWKLMHDPHPSGEGIIGSPTLVEYWFTLPVAEVLL